jgi:hypothetical protein
MQCAHDEATLRRFCGIPDQLQFSCLSANDFCLLAHAQLLFLTPCLRIAAFFRLGNIAGFG